jgi:hypothetical protein
MLSIDTSVKEYLETDALVLLVWTHITNPGMDCIKLNC